MNIFRNLVFWFIALLVVLVIGFWKTYFSVLFQNMHITHHFHGIAMLLWVLLLINQGLAGPHAQAGSAQADW